MLERSIYQMDGRGAFPGSVPISMEEGWHEELTMPEGYSGAVWAKEPLEIVWKQAEAEL